MELMGKAAALAAAFAILAALTACASSDETARATPATGVVLPDAAAHAAAMKDLAGMQPADMVSLLGPPDLQRDEPPAALWQYRAANCVLNLFFYREAGGYRLAHAEAWQRALTGGSAPARCHDEDAPVKARLISRSAL